MRITLAQTSPKLNRGNLQEVISVIESVKESSDLIVFPELSLSGYMLQDKLYEDAWNEDELQLLKDLSTKIDIVVGAALKDGNVFRNTALYFSGGELLSKHIKVHLPNYGMFEEARYFEGGDKFESFEVNGKKISMLVCEDVWHDNVHKEIIKMDPDFVITLVASPARGFNDSGLAIEDKWYKIIKTLSHESNSKLIFVNRVGFEDGLGFWGGSCIVDNGNIVAKLPRFIKSIETFEV
ncbi:nitrilase-related carbon-nitrogen hydrolase [Sulfurimonas microaerophilic]|uniref:nitrilase-related carbon-nitrogen hydrolase n=1 Tax=Sulfurimonas microaerophilic TaxID=3058392 RepID=UPI0027148CFE|nr:nitrilase-related carbon-nitrogen hydrolase [Sulfurimonas sp. hsl 1-7]